MTKKRLNRDQAYETIDRIAKACHSSSDIEDIIRYLYYAPDISLLNKLLDSQDQGSVRDGAYILSELGESGTPLKEVARSLLSHPDVRTRYWAMNAVANCFEANAALEAILETGLVNDSDEFLSARASEIIAALRR